MTMSDVAESGTLRPEVWDRIKSFLSQLPSGDSMSRSANSLDKEAQLVTSFLADVTLIELFAALDAATKEKSSVKISQAANAVARVFGSKHGPDLLLNPQVGPHLTGGMLHPEAEVRKLTSKVLYKVLDQQQDGALAHHLLGSTVVPQLAASIADPDIATSQYAADSLLSLIKQVDGQGELAAVLQHTKAATETDGISGNSTILLRYADFITKAMAVSDAGLDGALATGCVDVVFRMLRGKDVLIQFSILELLEPLAATPRGTRFLFDQGTVELLLKMATGREDVLTGGGAGGRGGGGESEPDPILGGREGSPLPTIVPDARMTRAILSTVLKYADSSRDTDRLAAMQAICSLAVASSEGMRLVMEDPVLLQTWLDIRSMTTEMKAASMQSVARVLQGKPPGEEGELAVASEAASVELKKLLFTRLGTMNGAANTMSLLMKQLQAPIPTLRHAVYDILAAAAGQPTGWGIRLLYGFSGFKDFILDRRTETGKEGKEWKFSVVESTLQCDSKGILGGDLQEELLAHLKKGPFWAPRGEAEVETADM